MEPFEEPTILLVEDERLSRLELARSLRHHGYRVKLASGAKRAVNIAKSSEVGIVLLDVALRGAIDGIDVAAEIQRLDPGKEIIFVSAFLNSETEQKVRDLGIRNASWIEKPVASSEKDRLFSALDQLIHDRSRPGAESGGGDVHIEPIGIELYQAIEEHPELLRTLHWRKFEALMAELLETFGFEVELCRGTKDGGIDIFALKRSMEWGQELYILQAKRWTNRVGVEPVQRLLFLHQEKRATRSCLATTSTFTSGALDLGGRYRWQLSLRDYDDLRDWIGRALTLKVGGVR